MNKKNLVWVIVLVYCIGLCFAADTTPPKLTLSEPRDGAIVYKDSVKVVGKAEDSGGIKRVTVNGGTVTVTKSTSTSMEFYKNIYLLVGKNGISAIAQDTAGNQANVKRIVTRRVPVWTVDQKLKDLSRVTGLHMHTRLCPGSQTKECYDSGVVEEFQYLSYYCGLKNKVPREDTESISKYTNACNKVANHLDMDCDMYYSKYIQGSRYWQCHDKINSIVWNSNSPISAFVAQWALATVWDKPAKNLAEALVTLFTGLTKTISNYLGY